MKAMLEFDLEDETDESAFQCAIKAVDLWNAVSEMQDHPRFLDILQDNGLDAKAFLDEDDFEDIPVDEDEDDEDIVVDESSED